MMQPHTVVTPDNRIGGRQRGSSSRSILYLDQNNNDGTSEPPRMAAIASSSSDPPYEPPLTPLSYTTITTVADVAAAAMSASAASTNPRHSLRVPGNSLSSSSSTSTTMNNNPPSAAEARKHPKPPLQKRGSWLINAQPDNVGPHADSTRASFDMLNSTNNTVEVPSPPFSPIDGGKADNTNTSNSRPVSIVVDRSESEQDGISNLGWTTPPPASRRATHSFNNNHDSNNTNTAHPQSYTTSKYHKYNMQQQQQQQQQYGYNNNPNASSSAARAGAAAPDHSQFAAGSMMSLAGGEGPDTWTSLLITDQRNSITQRNQAYASMAVVAALIAGISITFLVEVNFDFEADSQRQTALLQVVVMGSMVVAFLALYATMVLSSQYYLVTKALGGVTAMNVVDEGDALANVNEFMKKTRTIRHLAVMAVVFTVPLFAVLIAAYGIAKTGLNGIGYASIGLGAFALLVFIHAIVSQQMAFTQPGPRTPIADLDSIKVGADADGYGGLSFSSSSFDMETKVIKKPTTTVDSADDAKRKEAKKMMQKFDNAVSTFKLFG